MKLNYIFSLNAEKYMGVIFIEFTKNVYLNHNLKICFTFKRGNNYVLKCKSGLC